MTSLWSKVDSRFAGAEFHWDVPHSQPLQPSQRRARRVGVRQCNSKAQQPRHNVDLAKGASPAGLSPAPAANGLLRVVAFLTGKW